MRWQIKREWHGRKIALITMSVAVSIILCCITTFSVQADEAAAQENFVGDNVITECSLIVAAVGETDAREMPDESAPVVISYRDTDSIYVTGETADGWYRVRYQDLTGYVRADQTTEIELDVEALNSEFAIEEEEGKLVVEEVERQRTEIRRSKIWGAVIILLVLGVFATGIVSAMKGGEKGDEGE